MLELTDNQTEVLKKLYSWYFSTSKDQYITVGGYAGTGKTTLVALLRKALNIKNDKLKVAFCSYTGKGTNVLKSKIAEQDAFFKQDNISTIHSLIYSPIEDGGGVIVGWDRKEKIYAELIIIDEASMVDQLIWSDIKNYGVPIIAVGDHGQLPPIQGNFNLIKEPQLVLKQIHRQAKENPIIQLSIQARETGSIKEGIYSSTVKKLILNDVETQEYMQEVLSQYDTNTLILCGYNFTRVKANGFIRQALGFETSQPQVNDRVICLRNNHKKGIFNGMQGNIISIHENDAEWFNCQIKMDTGHMYEGLIYKGQFNSEEPLNFTKDRAKSVKGDLFDFGYAITVHKAQGSEAKKVVLFEERFAKMDDEGWKRWLYTAVTRAQEELYIFGPADPKMQEF